MEDETDTGDAPCFAHLLVDGHPVDPETARDVARFRRAERARLVAARAQSAEDREAATAALIDGLERIVDLGAGTTIAAYWPIHPRRAGYPTLDEVGPRRRCPCPAPAAAPVGPSINSSCESPPPLGSSK